MCTIINMILGIGNIKDSRIRDTLWQFWIVFFIIDDQIVQKWFSCIVQTTVIIILFLLSIDLLWIFTVRTWALQSTESAIVLVLAIHPKQLRILFFTWGTILYLFSFFKLLLLLFNLLLFCYCYFHYYFNLKLLSIWDLPIT